MKIVHVLFFTAFLCIFSRILLHAQDTSTIEQNRGGSISFARYKDDDTTERSIVRPEGFLKSLLKMTPADSLALIRGYTDELGITHKRFQQYFKGIKVDNAIYLIHGKGKRVDVVNGEFEKLAIPSVVPLVREQDALSTAITFVGAEKYKWEDPDLNGFIRERSNDSASYFPSGELVICKDLLQGGLNWKLAWKLECLPSFQ